MTTIAAIDLTRIRADIGDTSATPALTDAEIDDCYVRNDEDFALARVCCLRQLLASAAKLHDYAGAGLNVPRSQVFKHLKELLEMYEKLTDKEVIIVGMRKAPSKGRQAPDSGGTVSQ